jgi:hypothetical protein
MGTASDNERIKLSATFLNNIAVGLALAGGVIPLFTALQALNRDEAVAFLLPTKYLPIMLVSIFAVLAAIVFRIAADHVLKKIKD